MCRLHTGLLKWIDQYRRTFLFCIMCGLLTHGSVFLYKYTWHDDSAMLFGVSGWENGRWLIALLGWLTAKLTSGFNYSLPFLNGMIGIVFIAVFCCMCVDLLEVKNKYLRAALGAVFTACPVVTATFGYMFTAPYYFLALLLAGAGAVCAAGKKKYMWILSGVCCCSVAALYPAYISVFLSLLLLWLLARVYKEDLTWKEFFQYGFRFALICVFGMLLYAALNKFFLWYTDSRLISYQGISNIADMGIVDYLRGICHAYEFFLFPSERMDYVNYGSSYLYVMGIHRLYRLVLCLALVMSAVMLWKAYRENAGKALKTGILIMLLPAACNFIFIMCPSSETIIHTLMVYGEMFLFVYTAWCMEYVLCGLYKKLQKPVKYSGMISLILMGAGFIYLDHTLYLKMQLQYEQYKSEMTVLTASIKLLDGYYDDMPVAVVFTGQRDAAVPKYQEFSEIDLLIPYAEGYMNPVENQYDLLYFLKNICGFETPVVDGTQFMELEEVQDMPVYPDAGSIRVIQGTVVVKL